MKGWRGGGDWRECLGHLLDSVPMRSGLYKPPFYIPRWDQYDLQWTEDHGTKWHHGIGTLSATNLDRN